MADAATHSLYRPMNLLHGPPPPRHGTHSPANALPRLNIPCSTVRTAPSLDKLPPPPQHTQHNQYTNPLNTNVRANCQCTTPTLPLTSLKGVHGGGWWVGPGGRGGGGGASGAEVL